MVCYNIRKIRVRQRREVRLIAITSASLPAKKRILTVCVKLFLEQGYKKTTVAQIVQQAYHVPEDEIREILTFIAGMDIRAVSERVMRELFKALAMRFEFTL